MSKHVLAAALAACLVTATPFNAVLAQTTTQDAKKETKAKPAIKTISPALAAMRERQKKCGAEWKEAKAAGKIQKGQTWPKYWSECNKRLKGST